MTIQLTPTDYGWNELSATPGVDEWLWLDTSQDSIGARGLHHGAGLPPTIPPGLTHVWGWGNGIRVRCRYDVDLANGGLVGSVLTWDQGASTSARPTERLVTPYHYGVSELAFANAPLWRSCSRIGITHVEHEATVSGGRAVLLTPLMFLRLLWLGSEQESTSGRSRHDPEE